MFYLRDMFFVGPGCLSEYTVMKQTKRITKKITTIKELIKTF